MPVITTVTVDYVGAPPVAVTTTEYRVDIVIDRIAKIKNEIRGQVQIYQDSVSYPNNALPNYTGVQVRPNNLIPNTPMSNVSNNFVNKITCNADRLFPALAGNSKWVRSGGVYPNIYQGAGTQTGNTIVAEYGENPVDAPGAGFIYTNLYRVIVPSAIPDYCCLKIVCGYPFGTLRLVYKNGARATADAIPSGYVRNKELQNKTGRLANHTAHTHANGMYSFQWLCISADTFGGRNAGFLDTALPALSLYLGDPFGSPSLQGWNGQTSTVLRSNVTLKGRWRVVDHQADKPTYYAVPGSYLGSDFAIPFVDTTPASNSIIMKPTFGHSLPAPALPANKYTGLILEITGKADNVDSYGVPFVSTRVTNMVVNGDPHIGQPAAISFGYMQPPYFPWDIKLRKYGPDDATVSWVPHLGHVPASVPTMAETTVDPILTRVGNAIILQGGNTTYADLSPSYQAAVDAAIAAASIVRTAAYAAAQAAKDASYAPAQATYDAAVAGPSATKVAAYAAAQATYDASPKTPFDQITLQNSKAAADSTFNAATAADYATYIAAINSADTTYNNAIIAADNAYTAAVAPSQAALAAAQAAVADAARITASTPTCTGYIYSAAGEDTNKTQAHGSMTLRVVSRTHSVEWVAGFSLNGVTPEYDPVSPNPITGYRYTWNPRLSTGGVNYSGPGIDISAVIVVTATVVGLINNATVTTSGTFLNQYQPGPYSNRTIRCTGLLGGDPSTPARGSIQVRGAPQNKEIITISDGAKTVVFGLNIGSGVPPGAVNVPATGGNAAIMNSLAAAINTSGLAVTAAMVVPTDLVCEMTFRKFAGQAGGYKYSAKKWIMNAPP